MGCVFGVDCAPRRVEAVLDITVSQAQFRWFALRRLLTSVFFAVSLAGVAALIVWVDYRMMFFAIVSVLFALIAVAYGVRMLRLAVSARTTAVLLSGTTLTRTVAGVAVAEPITCLLYTSPSPRD